VNPTNIDDTATPVPLVELAAAEAQAHARDTWRRSGGRLSGALLAARYGRSERRGRQQIAAARTDETGSTTPAANGTGNGTAPAAPGSGSGSAGVPAQPDPAAAGSGSGRVVVPARHGSADSRSGSGGSRVVVPPRPGPASGGTSGIGSAPPALPRQPRAARPSGTGTGPAPKGRQAPGAAVVPLPLLAVTVAAVVVVTVVCAVVSYSHIRDLATTAGMGGLAGWLPLGIDGLVVAASCSLIVDRQLGRPGHALAWAGVALGLAGSLAANVLAVDPTLVSLRAVRWSLAGYGPAALAVSGHLLFRMLGDR
jgi:Protein of unknown function (DUF2637)